jgi:sulfur carrier protein ThiS
MGTKIQVIINGLPEVVPEDSNLESVMKLFNELDPDLIVEHNGKYIYSHQYKTTRLSENDRIEFINPNLGG